MSNQAKSAISWSLVERVGVQIVRFIISIFLARLLFPSDFGLIGMITIFINFASLFVDSGFSSGIIRNRDAGEIDFSTVFYFNLVLALIFYFVLFISAPFIAKFYNQLVLVNVIRVLGLNIIINAFSTIQQALVTKYLEFKRLAYSTIISTVIGGIFGIIMAINNYGIWALVVYASFSQVILSFLLWKTANWTPKLVFSFNALKRMFGYSSRILTAGFSTTIFDNIYNVIIGKYYNVSQLGFYTKGYQLQQIPVGTLTAVLQRVSFPLFVTVQDDDSSLKLGFKNLIKGFAFVNFNILFILFALAEPLILAMFTAKWESSVQYFRLFCLLGLVFPLRSTMMNVFKIKGRAELYLRYELIRQFLLMFILIISIPFGIKGMIIGQIIGNVPIYFIMSSKAGKLINYTVKEQFKDLFPSLCVGVLICTIISFLRLLLKSTSPIIVLLILGSISILLLHFFARLFKINQYDKMFKEIVRPFIGYVRNVG